MVDLDKLEKQIFDRIDRKPFWIALDGRCASGKTTFAEEMRLDHGCVVIHMDDFYLPFEQRTEAQMSIPGGNIDFDRLLREVLLPLKSGSTVGYRPYRCHSGCFLEETLLAPQPIVVVEGSYSCHPSLRGLYDLCIFMTVSPEEQLLRIRGRDPALAESFQKQWIPREESYFSACDVSAHCDIVWET